MSFRQVLQQQAQEMADQALGLQVTQPSAGWIHTLRTALGMSGSQLGARLGVKKARVSQMEHMEAEGRITVQQLRKAADALGCDLVVAFRPRAPVNQMIARQARRKAQQLVAETDLHMRLEQQGLDDAHLKKELERLTDEFIRNLPRDLWNEDEQ
ncbi:MAG: mobile mystery protein A [Alcanivorax sp.]|nr:mobile mystery protein A [Alcanivorax sp.]